jgi:putative endonuclease
MKDSYIYILTNHAETTFYVGVTSNLEKRIYEHKNNLISGFSSKYKLHKLVYFERSNSLKEAINREKQLKNWHRQWKVNLIKEFNHNFDDLSKNWFSVES